MAVINRGTKLGLSEAKPRIKHPMFERSRRDAFGAKGKVHKSVSSNTSSFASSLPKNSRI